MKQPAVALLGCFLLVATLWANPCPIKLDTAACGYGNGEPIPDIAGAVEVTPSGHDDTADIQAAIDQLSLVAPNKQGFRGAVVFRPGRYLISGQLKIRASGILLRGHGSTLVATGTSRRTLIDVRGRLDQQRGPEIPLEGAPVPVGETALTVAATAEFKPGDRVIIHFRSTAEWIAALKMDRASGLEERFAWAPGTKDIEWEREVVSVDKVHRKLVLNTGVSLELDGRWGPVTVQTLRWPGRLRLIGVENLLCVTDATEPRDEEHAWMAISMENVENAWVSQLRASGFVSAAVWIGAHARAVTVRDCTSENPMGENAGGRRLGFYVAGQQVVVLRCRADQARSAFAVGTCTAGPVVFSDCSATHNLGDSGSVGSWATGVVFDGVTLEDAGIFIDRAEAQRGGFGWSAANCVIWNCSLATVSIEQPPMAQNFNVDDDNTPSLYRQQMADRWGPEAPAKIAAAQFFHDDAKPLARAFPPRQPTERAAGNWRVVAGNFVRNEAGVMGTAYVADLKLRQADHTGEICPIRWVPGEISVGKTEDLVELAGQIRERGVALVQVGPPVWYDQRRADRTVAERKNADVLGPFYEMPWARSGDGKAWDGLSKYDLTRFNPWYWERMETFAGALDEHGMLMLHCFYNNESLEEESAGWADFPWRPANCLQATGFRESPPYEKKKTRIHLASQFYDVSDPVRRDLHRALIWHGLDVLKDHPNVIHTISADFTGPIAFQQFFLDTVAEWEKARGAKARLALVSSKAITDAVLDDATRSPRIQLVDLRHWRYFPGGDLYAPETDGKASFGELRSRRFSQGVLPWSSPELIYRQVKEYRDHYPDLALLCPEGGASPVPAFMAGATLTETPDFHLAETIQAREAARAFWRFVGEKLGSEKEPLAPVRGSGEAWCVGNSRWLLVYSVTGDSLHLPRLEAAKSSHAWWFNPATGSTEPAVLAGVLQVRKPDVGPWLLTIELD